MRITTNGQVTAARVTAAIGEMDESQTIESTYSLGVEPRHSAESILSLQGKNASTWLTTPTYDGGGEVVHPSVLYFPTGFGGKRWWMAITPYFNGSSDYENPSILCSDDGITWAAPVGVTNPLVPDPGGSDYNADPNLAYYNGKLVITYRFYDASETQVYHRYMESSDGVTWSTPAEIFDYDTSARNEVSPSLYWDGSAWHWWAIDTVAAAIVYRTAATIVGLGSATPVTCTLNNSPVSGAHLLWHMEVREHGGVYVAIVSFSAAVGSVSQSLWLATSTDKTTWTFAPHACLVGDTEKPSAWDLVLYKSSVVWNLETPLLYYGGAESPTSTVNFHVGLTQLFPITGSPIRLETSRLYAASLLVGGSTKPSWKLIDVVNRADSALSPGIPTAGVDVSSYTISTLARNASNVATVVTTATNTLQTGSVVTITPSEAGHAGFAATGVTITRVNTTTFTYPNTGAEVTPAEADSGTISAKWFVYYGTGGVSGNRLYWVSGTAPGFMPQFNCGVTDAEVSFVQDGTLAEMYMCQMGGNHTGTGAVQFGFYSDADAVAGKFKLLDGSTEKVVVQGIKRMLPERFRCRLLSGKYFTVWYNDNLLCRYYVSGAKTGTFVVLRMQTANVRIGEIEVRGL